MSSADNGMAFSIERVFDAPRELVFATMTQGEHLQKWWGPQGCTITVLKHELRPGGIFHYRMGFGPGIDMHGKFTYQDIAPVERFSFINGFADAAGNYVRYARVPDWPLEVLNTVTLQEQGAQTLMRLQSLPQQATQAEMDTFRAGHDSMQQGFGGMYDVYAQYLATLKPS